MSAIQLPTKLIVGCSVEFLYPHLNYSTTQLPTLIQLPTKQIVECSEDLFNLPALTNVRHHDVTEEKSFLPDGASSGSELCCDHVPLSASISLQAFSEYYPWSAHRVVRHLSAYFPSIRPFICSWMKSPHFSGATPIKFCYILILPCWHTSPFIYSTPHVRNNYELYLCTCLRIPYRRHHPLSLRQISSLSYPRFLCSL